AGPAAGAGTATDGGELERGHRKVPTSGGQRHINTGLAEADDVGAAVAVHVGERARVGVVAAPAAGVGTEGGKLERGGRKVPACVGQRLEDAGLAEADDVGRAVPVTVGRRARIGVVAAPAAGVDTEGGELERGGGEVPAGGGERLEDAGLAEADDVGHVIAVNVRERARIG